MSIDGFQWIGDNIAIHWVVVMQATSRHNIMLDLAVYEEFCKYGGKKGIKITTWINQQMKEFIEEEMMI